MATDSPGSAAGQRRVRGNSTTRATLKRFLAVSLVAAVAGVGAVGSADADTAERGHVEVLELSIHNDQYAANDLGPAGPSLGDTDVYSGTAMRDGRRAGRGGGSCQVVHIDGEKRTTQCLITIELERGSLTMQSLWASGTDVLDMAITGGTGIYGDARGTARYWDIATPNERMRAEILH
ncbi:allene oxide cyclase barrel-like domain-containing protein [Streptomyces echinatus]|uniref:allene oxide cyclase barrel-like domain-containing protein n=1 Tax=Streptomyces echinatus TaxID=67293 RepID=UPI0037F50148